MLHNIGFAIYPYGLCVSNKVINGKQCTLSWYVDDNRLSHVETKEVDEILEILRRHIGHLTIQQGKKSIYLWMNIMITGEKNLEVEIEDQINEVIETFVEEITEDIASHTVRRLFMIKDNVEILLKDEDEIFHLVTSKLIYSINIVWSGLGPTLDFLCTRVTNSDKEAWKNCEMF